MTLDEAKKVAQGNTKDGCDCEDCQAWRIALWLMNAWPLVQAMEDAFHDTDSRHAFQEWVEDHPPPFDPITDIMSTKEPEGSDPE